MNDNVKTEVDFFNYLPEKVIIDFFNGLDVNASHIKVMDDNSGLMARVLNNLSGKTYKRQVSIDQNVQAGLVACSEWLRNLTAEATEHSYAIKEIQNILEKQNIASFKIVENSIALKKEIGICKDKIEDLDNRLKGVNLEIKSARQVDALTTAWKARDKQFQGLSIIEKVYYILSNLFYGPFHEYLIDLNKKNNNKTNINTEFQQLRNKLLECIQREKGAQGVLLETPLPRGFWLYREEISSLENLSKKQEVLKYLGSDSMDKKETLTMTYFASQYSFLPANEQESNNIVNHLLSPKHLINSLLHEMKMMGD